MQLINVIRAEMQRETKRTEREGERA